MKNKTKKSLGVFGFVLAFGFFISVFWVNGAQAMSSVTEITRNLTVGSVGADVKILQQFLNNNGYTLANSGVGSPGKETTVFGAGTKSALIKYQTAQGITATGVFDSNTRKAVAGVSSSSNTSYDSSSVGSVSNANLFSQFASSSYYSDLLAEIDVLRTQIVQLQSQINTLNTRVSTLASTTYSSSASSDDPPEISSIVVANGGSDGYIDVGDTITVTFNKTINPDSINTSLGRGSYVSGVSYSKTGGITISSAGLVTIKNIATFDMGSVSGSGTFTVKLALNSTGKILTITLTTGNDVEITNEDFGNATQISGTIEDDDSNEMESDSSIDVPSGTFGGNNSDTTPSISSIVVSNGGSSGYIDDGDKIVVTFDEALDPDTINSSLSDGSYVTSVSYSKTGGITISSAGLVTIKNIATFDMGSVSDSGTFTVKLALSSTGKVLTITLTSGDSIEITSESFSSATQIGGTIESDDGVEMESDSSVVDPTGTFGGEN